MTTCWQRAMQWSLVPQQVRLTTLRSLFLPGASACCWFSFSFPFIFYLIFPFSLSISLHLFFSFHSLPAGTYHIYVRSTNEQDPFTSTTFISSTSATFDIVSSLTVQAKESATSYVGGATTVVRLVLRNVNSVAAESIRLKIASSTSNVATIKTVYKSGGTCPFFFFFFLKHLLTYLFQPRHNYAVSCFCILISRFVSRRDISDDSHDSGHGYRILLFGRASESDRLHHC